MNGEIGILNVGLGDTKLSFDKDKPVERDRAAKIVTDMLQRGYAILVQVAEKDGKPLYMRAESFDPETCEYLIVGLPDSQEAEVSPPVKKAGKKITRLDATKTSATAIARSAGG